jgi:hypothetical protein
MYLKRKDYVHDKIQSVRSESSTQNVWNPFHECFDECRETLTAKLDRIDDILKVI